MLPTNSRGISKARKGGKRCSYEKMMKTLLLQNQQIIIQQQNMMFMVMRQFQQQPSGQSSPQQHQHHNPHHQTSTAVTPIANLQGNQEQQQHPQQQQDNHLDQQKFHQIHLQEQQQQATPANSQQQHLSAHPQQQHQIHHQNQQQIVQHHHQTHSNQSIQQQFLSHHQTSTPTSITSTNPTGQPIVDTQLQLQQATQNLHDNMGGYMTPAASEQDPISDNKQGDEDLHALLESDGLLDNNLLYNPEADTGSITPYKNHQQQQQTPSYYSSGCESLTTPRVEQPRQQTTNNINQNVVKNLADSFKSPSKPKINVQILSGSATRNLKNSKAKIIQTMNISEFLRQVHHDDGHK